MTKDRVHEIDLLRFVAALSVVFYHYAFRGYAADAMSIMPYPLLAPAAKYGYLGVHLFFMISGFVILMTARTADLRTFVVSRAVRLYPAFWVCCTLTYAATLAFGAPRFTASPGQYLVNMTMLAGFLGVPALDGVYWSLLVELKFYALVALVLHLGRIHRAQPLLAGWLLAAGALEWSESFPRLRWVLATDWATWFIAGAAFFLIRSDGLTPARLAIVAGSWGLALHQGIRELAALDRHYHASFGSGVVAGVITIYYLAMFLVATRRTGAVARRRWLAAGALTYPLYLLHQHVGFMVFNRLYPTVNPHLLFWGMILVVLGLAHTVHVLVERPGAPALRAALMGLAARVGWRGGAPTC